MKRYEIKYLPEAKQDIEDIFDYIGNELKDGFAAKRILWAIVEKCESLSVFPNGHAVRLYSHGQAIRFAHYGHYTIAYFVNEDTFTVNIYAVKYSRMDLKTAIDGQ